MEAINSPVGKVAQALFNDQRIDGLTQGGGFAPEWLEHVNCLLSLDDDLRRYALVIFTHNLSWFYYIDSHWTVDNLLPALECNDTEEQDAAWSGFFWGEKVPNQELFERMKPKLLGLATERSLSRHGHSQMLASIILAGWGGYSEKTGECCVSNSEMRDVLLWADDEFRSHVLWDVERWSKAEGKVSGDKWSAMLPELIRDTWPRQMSAKSPTISARLCNLAFSNVDRFPEMAEIILPLLTTIDRDHLMLPNLRESGEEIFDQFPDLALGLLYAVLPENIAAWPYEIEGVLQRIGTADKRLKKDERLIELIRKWNSR